MGSQASVSGSILSCAPVDSPALKRHRESWSHVATQRTFQKQRPSTPVVSKATAKFGDRNMPYPVGPDQTLKDNARAWQGQS